MTESSVSFTSIFTKMTWKMHVFHMRLYTIQVPTKETSQLVMHHYTNDALALSGSVRIGCTSLTLEQFKTHERSEWVLDCFQS